MYDKSNICPINEKIIFLRNLPIDKWDENIIRNLFCEFGQIEEIIKYPNKEKRKNGFR